MEQFLTPETLDFIQVALVICAACAAAWFCGDSAMRRHDEEWLRENPPRFEVNPSNAADLLAGMESLRTPLRSYRNPTEPSYYDPDTEDLRRGTSDNLLDKLP